MTTLSPNHVRNADIVSISQRGKDEVEIEMANGNFHKLSIDEVIQDWLSQHKKLRQVGDWVKRRKETGET